MKMKKRVILFLSVIALIVSVTFLVSAKDVCCEKTLSNEWCVTEDESQCASGNSAPTACESTTFCQSGTCVDIEDGICMPHVSKAKCEKDGGLWNFLDKEDIPQCKSGCCLIGEQASFVTETQCKNLATDFHVDINFRADIRDEPTCLTLSTPTHKGACVVEETRDCTMKTKETCPDSSRFYEGVLCTAEGLSDCAKSQNTECGDDGRVYYMDSCGNEANVYDANKWNDDANYWTYIADFSELCSTSGESSSTCGNCDYVGGTVCSEFSVGAEGMPESPPSKGDYVCKESKCYYENKVYNEGESWCANVSGVSKIIVNNNGTLGVKITDVFNPNSYNVPGSRYYQLYCSDGEIIPYPCADLRNEICKETTVGDHNIGKCVVNRWRNCFALTTRTECLDLALDCNWIPGYRFDGEILKEEEREEGQGSCVPLYAPGFNLRDSASEALCTAGVVIDRAVYESGLFVNRDKFEDIASKEVSNVCLEGCYAIPGYGAGLDVSKVREIYEGGSLGKSIDSYNLSTRIGQYCLAVEVGDIEGSTPTPEERALGWLALGERSVLCTDSENRRIAPLFYTNAQWLESITTRAKSIGDCGYTINAQGDYGDEGSEIISAIFNKLNQDGSVKTNGTAQVIYEGREYSY